MKKFVIILLLIPFIFSCQDEVSDVPLLETKPAPLEKPVIPESKVKIPSYEVVAILSVKGGYGYHILQNGVLFIKQEIVPSVQGTKRFKTAKDALIIGEFVADKLRKGIMPPTISPDEIDSLGAVIL